MNIDIRSRSFRMLCLLVAPVAFAGSAIGAPVSLVNPTVTFCQDGFPIDDAVDGNFGSGTGWAVYGQIGNNQTAVFKALNDVGRSAATDLAFQLHMFWGSSHILGKFRLSATTSDRSSYGQGATCNDATPAGSADWSVLVPQSVGSQNGQTLSVQPDGTVLASGGNPGGDMVTFRVQTSMKGITGFRLEALADSSFPDNGPGRASNGNFVLNELTVAATPITPVPAVDRWAMVLMALLLAAMGLRRLRTQRS